MTPAHHVSLRQALLVLAGIAGVPVAAIADATAIPVPVVVEVSAPVTPHVFDGDLRSLPTLPEWQPGDPIKVVPRRFFPPAALPLEGPQMVDPLVALQRSTPVDAPSAFTTPVRSFAGISFTGVQPPDTVGDVGAGHYIQMVNSSTSSFKVWDKAGNALTGNVALGTLGATGACANGWGDPIVLYDALADRWLMSEFTSGNRFCVYVSQTSDPISGGWNFYSFQAPNFPDYPHYSVWSDAYYITSNEGGNPPIYALDRQRMLAGQAATFQRFTVSPPLAGFGFQALTPADHDGSTAPPAGSPAFMARHRDDESHGGSTGSDYLDLWAVHVDWTTPANSSVTQFPSVAVAEFDSNLCGLTSFNCFPQPGTGQRLDPLREVIMQRLSYRNFGTHEALVGNFVTDVGDFANHGGVRWFELRRTGGGNWTLRQEGTYSPDAHHRWMAGVAMDQQGNMALAYSVSSTSVFPSIRYTGRQTGDALGVMTQGETSIVAGAASQTSGERWGDYAAMGVDPADDCTFWFTTEYTPQANWRTHVAAMKFDSCGGGTSSGVDYIVGEGLGPTSGNLVSVRTSAGAATAVSFPAYGAGAWGTNVASANVDGGAQDEMITGPGPGAVYGPQVRAFDRNGAPLGKVNFYAYGTLRYGANVAGGSTDADAFGEMVSGAGPGVVFGPHVRGWNFDGSTLGAIAGVNFFAYATLRYGVNVGEGDVDDDGFQELLTGAGPSGAFGSSVRGWNVDGGATTPMGSLNFNAFTYTGYGVNVAGGDVDGDGFAEIDCAPGPGPTHPSRFRGFNYDGAAVTALAGYDITPFTTTYGGRVGVGDLLADGTADLLSGAGRDPAATSAVRAYAYAASALSPLAGTPFTPFTGTYGVNVAAGTLGH